MTTASRATTAVRIAAAGLLGALALTACDSGGSGAKDDTSPTPSASGTAGTGGGTGGTTAKSGALEGSWLATTGGKAVALMVTGGKAALFTTGGTMCSGTAGEEAGMRMIHLKCTDGSKNRGTGMVDSVNKTTLEVTWEGGLGKETYTKAEDGTLPSGLPTASLGS
ncbi:hypothetical protein RKE30_02255 [Streptomyces sp. Li-HN-5-11]|uniref:hypothetical protein n=1 Tax=Streptomyces sp. Li-HN-5-11 TaxID=3075432 RepID=UPI0028B0E547|nr:hypothetical protein [Streptomyces sp. Li-HN-5-11]WNM29301.1 hypothetical protein RKE30_02255 [Streptomyces sp. Li-HN-5-11]